LEAPEIDEEEIRKQITEEFELREKQKIAQLEEEIKRAEQEKQEEIRGKTLNIKLQKKVLNN
jgi:dynein intermediate chain